MKCRHCDSPLQLPFLDLGSAPPSNAYLSEDALRAPETWYPLRVLVCQQCWLVQTEDYAQREVLFTHNYAYFSSSSSSWLSHAQAYVNLMQQHLELNRESCVVEIAANDGYLLGYVQQAGIPCYGIEPTASTAAAARVKGIEVIEEFFGAALAEKLALAGRQADLVVANNVLAHVPDINDFVTGFARLLKPQGVATFEFPQLLKLVQHHQFDTIYHEHFSYLSLTAVQRIFQFNGLSVFDVQQLTTHGGSLRVYAQRADTGRRTEQPAVARQLSDEAVAGVSSQSFYTGLQAAAERVKHDFLSFLLQARQDGLKVGAYGAAAKGNTLLNFCGVRPDLLPYVVDRSREKVGRFLPGSRIPIVAEDHLRMHRPELILLPPWNLRGELATQLAYTSEWGAKLFVVIPRLECFSPGSGNA